MQETFYFRVKIEGLYETDDKSLQKSKPEYLVEACNYTDAESIATTLASPCADFGDVNIEIVKTKIQTIIGSEVSQKQESLLAGHIYTFYEETEDSGVGMYGVKVLFITIDERTGKEKKTNEMFYVSAYSNTNAAERVVRFLETNDPMRTFVVRDIKFDKVEGVLFTPDTYSKIMKGVA